MSLQLRLLLGIGYVLLVALVAFEVPLAVNTANRIDSEVRAQAAGQADLLAVAAAEELGEGPKLLQELATVAAETVRGRVVIVNGSGQLVADSEREARGTDFSNRPEISTALAGRRFQERRDSDTLGIEIIATAAPMRVAGEVVGAVRITQSTESESRATLDAVGGLILIGLVVLAIGLVAATLIARGLAEPLRALTGSAEKIAGGDLSERAPVSGSAEQQTLARAFNRMTERLAATLQRQREFVADASHLLRTPLSALRLRIEEARAGATDAGGVESRAATVAELDAATAEVDRLSGIVDDLLTLSRIGERDAPLSEVDLLALAAAAVERFRPDAERRSIDLRLSHSGGGVAICSAEDAERALEVLVENALNYSPPRTVVTVGAHDDRIEVADEGPGIGGDELEQVFERFHRGDAGRARGPGTGLGLPIARGLAREWGGDVTLEPRDPRGLRATLWFRRSAP